MFTVNEYRDNVSIKEVMCDKSFLGLFFVFSINERNPTPITIPDFGNVINQDMNIVFHCVLDELIVRAFGKLGVLEDIGEKDTHNLRHNGCLIQTLVIYQLSKLKCVLLSVVLECLNDYIGLYSSVVIALPFRSNYKALEFVSCRLILSSAYIICTILNFIKTIKQLSQYIDFIIYK